MFSNSSDCNTQAVLACSDLVFVAYQWRLLCQSGLFAEKTNVLFSPLIAGSAPVKWPQPYPQLFGTSRILRLLPANATSAKLQVAYKGVRAAARNGALGEVLKSNALDNSLAPAIPTLLGLVRGWSRALVAYLSQLSIGR